MSRLRATLSVLPVDKMIAEKVSHAQRSLQEALRLCDYRKETDLVTRRRIQATHRDIQRAMGALGSVRRIGTLSDDTDPPDLVVDPATRRKVVGSPAPTEPTALVDDDVPEE